MGSAVLFAGVYYLRCRSSCSQMLFRKGALKNFTKFTGKYLYWSLFLLKLQVWRLATLLKKENPTHAFSCEFSVSFKRSFFTEHLDDCFWRCHAEIVVASYIDHPTATALKLKEHLAANTCILLVLLLAAILDLIWLKCTS